MMMLSQLPVAPLAGAGAVTWAGDVLPGDGLLVPTIPGDGLEGGGGEIDIALVTGPARALINNLDVDSVDVEVRADGLARHAADSNAAAADASGAKTASGIPVSLVHGAVVHLPALRQIAGVVLAHVLPSGIHVVRPGVGGALAVMGVGDGADDQH